MAAREVRKLVFSPNGGKYKDIEFIINDAPKKYEGIIDEFRQENFVVAVSVMYFLHNNENHPDFLFPWLFRLLQHKNGNIRHSAVRMLENELGPLTFYIRFPGKESSHSKTTKAQADQILLGLRLSLESLAASSYKPSYKKYKYIDSLPSGTYKSVQHILVCLEDYCSEIHKSMEIESKQQILERRKEIEEELLEMLKETKSDFGLEDIKEIIYNEDGQDGLTDVIAMFDIGQSAAELQNVLELVNDAWNYFPHKIIGGLSPAEKLLEYQKLDKN